MLLDDASTMVMRPGYLPFEAAMRGASPTSQRPHAMHLEKRASCPRSAASTGGSLSAS
jgi:hypothetical protein